MEPQQIFDTVAKHLLKQGKRALSKDAKGVEICAYRAADGTRCAAGCLIPDELYSPSMEGQPIRFLAQLPGAVLPNFFEDNLHLISDLQVTHDMGEPSGWPRALEVIAHKYNLNTDALLSVTA